MENTKTEAILRLYHLEKTWCTDIEYNDGSLNELLHKIASDIYEGYVTYDAFVEIVVEVAGKISLHNKEMATGEDIDKYVSIVKRLLTEKYAKADFYSNYN